MTTRLRIDPEDARFLGPALERLPGAETLYSPATVDLNGEIAIRAGGGESAGVTELVLCRSSYSGTPTRINVNRTLPGPGRRARLRRDRHRRCRVARRLPRVGPHLCLAAPERRVGHRPDRGRDPHRVESFKRSRDIRTPTTRIPEENHERTRTTKRS